MKPPQLNKPLSEVCTLGIGGLASMYLEIKTISEMQQAIAESRKNNIPYFVLGKGSNCLFDDRGFKGCILHNKIDFLESDQKGKFTVGAGYSFSLLGAQTARLGFQGLEFASGIPGSIGGAVFMNAGANGQETKDYITEVQWVDGTGEVKNFTKEELNFKYRHSIFHEIKEGAIVSATFQLIPFPEARQKQLEIIQYRQKTQPLSAKSAGCIFVNPKSCPAGKLIEQCGLKGFTLGKAQVSEIHGNFLINLGNATAQEFMALIEHVKTTVKEKENIDLQSEIRVIPYEF